MFNIAFQAKDAKDAKLDLRTRNKEQETPMSDKMLKAVHAVIDALPGEGGVAVGIYGDEAGTVNLSVSRVPAPVPAMG